MDFLNEFSKRFTSVARSVTEKNKEGAEVTRLNGELKDAQAALEQLYARYGRLCYLRRSGGGDAQAEEALAVRIQAGELQVDELTLRRDAAREFKRCLSCGAVHPKEAKFCSACGKRLPDEAPKPEPVAEGEYCPTCGAQREGGEPRCPVCGAYFDATPDPELATVQPAPTADAPDIEEPDDALE